MADKQDRQEDDIQRISQQFQLKTTIVEPNLNMNEQQQSSLNQPSKSKNNRHTLNTTQDTRNKTVETFDENLLFNDYLPGLNLPEKIVFVIDTASTTEYTPFKRQKGCDFEPLEVIRRVVDIFVALKSAIQSKHEYAVVALNYNSASWIGDFTNNRKIFTSYLSKLGADKTLSKERDLCDLGPCFETICQHTTMEENLSNPQYVSRVILIYGRSHEIPIFKTGRQYYDRLFRNSHFYLDLLYVHEPPAEGNNCQVIYNKLGKLDHNRTSYMFEVGRSVQSLDVAMAKLLAHPLQRARQDDSPYSLYEP